MCSMGYHSDTPIGCEVPLQLGFVSDDQRRKTRSGASKDSAHGVWRKKCRSATEKLLPLLALRTDYLPTGLCLSKLCPHLQEHRSEELVHSPVLALCQRDLLSIVELCDNIVFVEDKVSMSELPVTGMRIDNRPYLPKKLYLLSGELIHHPQVVYELLQRGDTVLLKSR